MARYIQQGDELELKIDEKIGWVTAFCSYAAAGNFILDTREHGRFPMSDPDHPDIRNAPKKR